ncbi:hypothetical protein BDV95DRAFT_590324 [Massariosphaeria phaeospora]|uniref:Uncharacterized protein n=1 Tax=Massariosphaeria phaeospora TaxID=100035 RepID=A0A7C8IMK7_9PLEO|nr:hypothetical protein BDV95DRAFT_590324 [Massariosphaeria phaeospora]
MLSHSWEKSTYISPRTLVNRQPPPPSPTTPHHPRRPPRGRPHHHNNTTTTRHHPPPPPRHYARHATPRPASPASPADPATAAATRELSDCTSAPRHLSRPAATASSSSTECLTARRPPLLLSQPGDPLTVQVSSGGKAFLRLGHIWAFLV